MSPKKPEPPEVVLIREGETRQRTGGPRNYLTFETYVVAAAGGMVCVLCWAIVAGVYKLCVEFQLLAPFLDALHNHGGTP